MTHGLYDAVQWYALPMTHGPYGGAGQPSTLPMTHGAYSAVQWYALPMTHGLYGAVRGFALPMTHGPYGTVRQYALPMTHGPYGTVRQYALPMTHGAYGAVRWYALPMTHGAYGAVRGFALPMTHGAYGTVRHNTPSSSVSSLQSSSSLADLLKTRSPPCQTSQHMVFPVLPSFLDTLSTLLADGRDIENMENSFAGTSPEDSLEILPKPPEFLSGYLESYSSSEETRRLLCCFWDLLPRVGSFPMDDFLVPQIILELPPSHPPNLPIFLDTSLSLATLSRNSGTFANLGEPPDFFHQESQLMSPDVAIFEDLSLYPHRLYPNQNHQDDPVTI
ncbi:hypothetical protein BJ322DRAFT_1114855 [Thelephora terrestris]|uniref:Uncharacterized protein n=1 Tax=Thelephora terrestris TaxID=56493 RepID=A0A9P6H278_9AGAM|nr:hypothetical protein BJ322DRAFT_1114855 [Thelephora terrestris]